MKIKILAEREWMGGHERWLAADVDEKVLGRFGSWKNRTALMKAIEARSNGEEIEIVGEVKVDNYARFRGIEPKKGWIIREA